MVLRYTEGSDRPHLLHTPPGVGVGDCGLRKLSQTSGLPLAASAVSARVPPGHFAVDRPLVCQMVVLRYAKREMLTRITDKTGRRYPRVLRCADSCLARPV